MWLRGWRELNIVCYLLPYIVHFQALFVGPCAYPSIISCPPASFAGTASMAELPSSRLAESACLSPLLELSGSPFMWLGVGSKGAVPGVVASCWGSWTWSLAGGGEVGGTFEGRLKFWKTCLKFWETFEISLSTQGFQRSSDKKVPRANNAIPAFSNVSGSLLVL